MSSRINTTAPVKDDSQMSLYPYLEKDPYELPLIDLDMIEGICQAKATYSGPLTCSDNLDTTTLPAHIMDMFHRLLDAYIRALLPPWHLPRRSEFSLFFRIFYEYPCRWEITMETRKQPTSKRFNFCISETLPMIPRSQIYPWLQRLSLEIFLTDCQHPRDGYLLASGTFTKVSDLYTYCPGARVLGALTKDNSFHSLHSINLDVVENFCFDINQALAIYKSAGFRVQAEVVNIRIRWHYDEYGYKSYHWYPRLRAILRPRL